MVAPVPAAAVPTVVVPIVPARTVVAVVTVVVTRGDIDRTWLSIIPVAVIGRWADHAAGERQCGQRCRFLQCRMHGVTSCLNDCRSNRRHGPASPAHCSSCGRPANGG